MFVTVYIFLLRIEKPPSSRNSANGNKYVLEVDALNRSDMSKLEIVIHRML